MLSRNLIIAAVVACLLAAIGDCEAAQGRMLLTGVAQYQHCGTDQSGSFGCCAPGFICAYSNPWWSMCVTADECPKQGGYTCSFDGCGKPVEIIIPKPVPHYQHCGNDVTGSYGCCAVGMKCAFQNAYWSMCVTAAECPKQGGYQCNRNRCGKIV